MTVDKKWEIQNRLYLMKARKLELENFIIHRSCDIEQWFRIQWLENQAPFYGSVDLRNSGFKLAPVDMNLFPGGFNNLNPDLIEFFQKKFLLNPKRLSMLQ